jgi:hypothetical protein
MGRDAPTRLRRALDDLPVDDLGDDRRSAPAAVIHALRRSRRRGQQHEAGADSEQEERTPHSLSTAYRLKGILA